MARLKNKEYRAISINQLHDPVVFVIDMVKGFVEIGALHDKAIQKIEVAIKDVLEKLDCNNIFVCDAHPPKTREFHTFPAHCQIGTTESEIVDSLQDLVKHVIKKNSTNAFVSNEFQDFLQNDLKYYKDIIVTGCCTDLCVLHFVLTLNAWFNEHNMNEYRIIVVENCVETYHIPEVHDANFYNDVALKMMCTNGIMVVSEIEE